MEEQNKQFKKGSYLYVEGDEDGNEVFIIQKGEVTLEVTGNKIQRYRSVAKKGDIVGFISALSDRPRTESAAVTVDTVVHIFSRERFLLLLQKKPKIAVRILNYFAEELRIYDRMIFSKEECGNSLSDEELLFNLGSFYYNGSNYSNAYYILLRYQELYPGGDSIDEVRQILQEIESAGERMITEPIRNGIDNIYADKQIIFCEQEPGNELYIVKEGKVKIVKHSNNSEIMLSILKEGDVLGELAIVSDKPRNATAISYGKTILLSLNRDTLFNLLETSPKMVEKIFVSVSLRVWFTFIRIEARLYENPLTKIYAFLENKLLENNISLKSKDPYIFNFGLDELLKMINVKQEDVISSMDELLADQGLRFNFGQIVVENPQEISAKAKLRRSRDYTISSGSGQ
ncbi:MAG: cyclic nucleotide-binding domain-containing protein [bacterium]|nr:cyclic nucleotide-binding domain-containing protein [bacterium]